MADATIQVEARLKDYVSKNIDKIVRDVKRFGENGGKSFEKTTQSANKFNAVIKQSSQQMGGFLMRFGPAAIAIGVVTKAIMALGNALRFVRERTIEFEFTMSHLQAIAVPTQEEFSKLSQRARELGESTVFTASQAGEAFVEMAKLGMKTNEIISASQGVLDLAAIAQISMAESATITGQTLKQFGLDASESTHIVDVMAKSFTTSALDIQKFSNAMTYAGPIAGNTGVSIEKTTAALAILADRGIDASMAGTALRRILLELADETSKANKFIRAAGIEAFTLEEKLQALADAGMDATSATEMFGLRATTAIQILAANTKSVNELAGAYENAGGAARKMAETMLDNVRGATIKLKSAQEGLALALGETWAPGKKMVIDAQTALVKEQTRAVKEGVLAAEDMLNVWQRIQLAWYNMRIESTKRAIAVKGQAGAMVPSMPGVGTTSMITGERKGQITLGDEAEIAKRAEIMFGGAGEAAGNAASRVDRLHAAMLRQSKTAEEIAKLRAEEAGGIDDVSKASERASAKQKQIQEDERRYIQDRVAEIKKQTEARQKQIDVQIESAEKEIKFLERRGELEKQLQLSVEDAKVANIRNAAEREMAELKLQQARELEQYENYNIDVTELMKEHAIARDIFDEKMLKQQKQRRADAIRSAAQSSAQLISILVKDKESRKKILTGIAIAEGAASVITAVKSGWDTGITAYDKAALAILMGITAAAQTAVEIATIQNARTGTDQVVRGEKLFRAGEAGPERVTITPASSDLESRSSGARGTSVVFSNTYHIAGNLDRAAANSIIEAEERLAKQIAGMHNDGF
ncbi:MAG: phage tail tape measure protein [Gammaproteobacteria bacterium]|nr:phage tail tape measure protein [Gammaproteobacteria bacterium]